MGNFIAKFFSGDSSAPPAPPSSDRRERVGGGGAHQPLGPHGVTPVTVGVAALALHLLNFYSAAGQVPEGLTQHVKSSKKSQANWYKKLLEAWKSAILPPRNSEEASRFVINTLRGLDKAELEGILKFYGLPLLYIILETSDGPRSWPDGVQFVLHTLPVDAKAVVDGDGFNAYVDMANAKDSADVPLKVYEAVTERARARLARDYKRADDLQKSIVDEGYRVINHLDGEILAKKYRIRLRGIDAPECSIPLRVDRGIGAPEHSMPFSDKSKDALCKLIAGKSLKIYVYEFDQYGRAISDVYCNEIFIQEQMLKSGFAWHYKTYDSRPEFSKWEKEAKAAGRGIWALSNPEKPWEWRRNMRNAIPIERPIEGLV